MSDAYEFGYPRQCNVCETVPGDPGRALNVGPFYRPGDSFRLMLIGQDPTIRKRPERVSQVLMLDQPNGQLSRWLRDLLGDNAFNRITIYATNVVKCSFPKPPSDMGGYRFLKPYSNNCRRHLVQEVACFRPALVISLGEPSHKIFRAMLDKPELTDEAMQDAFTGNFAQVSIEGVHFAYTPCLHIQTFRVAETYGSRVMAFREGLKQHLSNSE